MTIPPTMRAIDPATTGGPEVLTLVERPTPVLAPGEVLIRVHAAGVNRPDVLQRKGRYPMPPGAPSILGLEVSGEIVRVGSAVHRWQGGERVTALLAGGGYAEYATAPEGQCLPIPGSLTMVEAASLPETHFTVWKNLIEGAKLRAGETALVHGGTSGIGVTAIQVGRAMGARIIVTVGSAAKAEAALALGAEAAIDYSTQDFVAEVAALTDSKGVDIVLDMISADYIPRNLACLASGGRHVSIATQHGQKAEVDIGLIMRKGLHMTGSLLRPQPIAIKAAIARSLEREVWPLIASGGVRAVIDRTYRLEEAADAHARMEASQHVGKIVLEVL